MIRKEAIAFNAEGNINPNTLVMQGAADFGALQANGSTAKLLGYAGQVGAETGERVDVHVSGVAKLIAGGTITRGDWVTSDANGKAVAAAPGAGVNAEVIGRALQSAVADDLFDVLVNPTRIQG